jgi:glycosyltransferase involved in cell wall biosynthesis
MNVLLLNQFFAPDPAPTGQLLSDVARELAARGHSVTVVCARTAYAPASSSGAPEEDGRFLRVLRIPTARFEHGAAGRILSYASFYWGALWRALLAPRPDVVVTLTTPPLLCLLGGLVRALRGGHHYIWEMDVYPDIAVALGVLAPGSRLARTIGVLADRSRRRADAVIALGPCMRDRLAARGIPSEKIRIAENWADGALVHPTALPAYGPFTVLYSGNLGLAHEIDTIAQAMELLKDDGRFRFVFAGGGPRRAALEQFCASRGIANALFLPYQEQENLSSHLAACHAGLVTQTPGSLGAVVPSKIHALMAAARPVLFVGPPEATPARILQAWKCGWQIAPGDPAALVRLLDRLAGDRALAEGAAARARRAFLARYDRPAGVARILEILDPSPAALSVCGRLVTIQLSLPESSSHESSHNRHYGPGRFLPGRIPTCSRLRSPRPETPLLQPEHRPGGSPL